MQCHESRQAISKLLDGLLDYEEEFAVRQHINGCPDCRVLLTAFEQDEQALTGYVRQAPYAPVAREVIGEIERQRSPWWDAFMAGSYRLASVAGLVLVVLVVGAGAWMLREVATSDPPADDQPVQETTLGAADQGDGAQQLAQSGPLMIGLDEVDLIVDELDEAGLVFDVDEVSETGNYTVEYRRVAVDRSFTFVEYRAERSDDDVEVGIHAMLGDGGSKGIPFEGSAAAGWMVFPNAAPESSVLELSDFLVDNDGGGMQNAFEVDLDLSAIPANDAQREVFDNAVENNGVEVCCLEIERGVAVSTIGWDRNVADIDDVVYLDESMQPVEDPPILDASADLVWPEIMVNGEPLPVLDQTFSIGPETDRPEQRVVGVLGLPAEGTLEVHNETMMLLTDGEEPNWTYFQGPWTISTELGDSDQEFEPTPEPTEPPMVAAEETPEPESTPAPEQDADTPDSLRVLVYLVRDDEIGASSRQINYTRDVATASIESLLNGPLYEDEDVGLHSEIPAGTELLDIALEDGTLMVDLSSEFSQSDGADALQMRMAQVVHTATQFDTVMRVDLRVDGQTIAPRGGGGESDADDLYYTRDDFEDEAPAILIETPAPHDVIGNQIRLTGTANTFEANLQIEVLDPKGEQVYRDHAMASSGTGTRGEFDLTIPVEFEGEGIGAVRMFEHSARDGSRTNVVTIPVRFQS